MDIRHIKTVCVTSILAIVFLIGGCGERVQVGKKELAPEIDLGTTIGSLAEVFWLESIPVEGYGLVGGLRGTGSSECPLKIRAYLKQYILTQSSELDVEKLISSNNTAVVLVQGIMPTAVSEYFDVKVAALPGTQTTSLEGGRLYGAELKRAGSLGVATKTLAVGGSYVSL